MNQGRRVARGARVAELGIPSLSQEQPGPILADQRPVGASRFRMRQRILPGDPALAVAHQARKKSSLMIEMKNSLGDSF